MEGKRKKPLHFENKIFASFLYKHSFIYLSLHVDIEYILFFFFFFDSLVHSDDGIPSNHCLLHLVKSYRIIHIISNLNFCFHFMHRYFNHKIMCLIISGIMEAIRNSYFYLIANFFFICTYLVSSLYFLLILSNWNFHPSSSLVWNIFYNSNSKVSNSYLSTT